MIRRLILGSCLVLGVVAPGRSAAEPRHTWWDPRSLSELHIGRLKGDLNLTSEELDDLGREFGAGFNQIGRDVASGKVSRKMGTEELALIDQKAILFVSARRFLGQSRDEEAFVRKAIETMVKSLPGNVQPEGTFRDDLRRELGPFLHQLWRNLHKGRSVTAVANGLLRALDSAEALYVAHLFRTWLDGSRQGKVLKVDDFLKQVSQMVGLRSAVAEEMLRYEIGPSIMLLSRQIEQGKMSIGDIASRIAQVLQKAREVAPRVQKERWSSSELSSRLPPEPGIAARLSVGLKEASAHSATADLATAIPHGQTRAQTGYQRSWPEHTLMYRRKDTLSNLTPANSLGENEPKTARAKKPRAGR